MRKSTSNLTTRAQQMALTNRLAQQKKLSTKNSDKKGFQFDKESVSMSPTKQKSLTTKNYTRKFKPSERTKTPINPNLSIDI